MCRRRRNQLVYARFVSSALINNSRCVGSCRLCTQYLCVRINRPRNMLIRTLNTHINIKKKKCTLKSIHKNHMSSVWEISCSFLVYIFSWLILFGLSRLICFIFFFIFHFHHSILLCQYNFFVNINSHHDLKLFLFCKYMYKM